MTAAFETTYGQVLEDYVRSRSEDALYRASLLSQTFVERGIGPEEIIALHFQQLDHVMSSMTYREQARSIGDAHQFLLEMMIAYGVQHKEFLELRMRESVREADARAELEMARAQEHERMQLERSALLEQIAHELRTPLTAVQGSLDMAKRALSRGQADRVPALIDAARDALDRLTRLTANLVQASQGDLPQLTIEPQPLYPLISQVAAWAEPMAVSKHIRFTTELETGDAVVLCDADGVLSIISNLIANAIRYTPEGGSVTLRAGTGQSAAWIEIQDTGIGMSAEVQPRIFEKFYRSPEARRVDAQGLGLGLALVKDLVTAHAGTLTCESTEGAGSTFRIELPMPPVMPDGAAPDAVRETQQ